MFPVHKSIFGTLTAFVLVLSAYICASSFRDEPEEVLSSSEQESFPNTYGTDQTPTRLPDFSEVKSITAKDQSLESYVAGPFLPTTTNSERLIGLKSSSQADQTSLKNSTRLLSDEVAWQYPNLVIPSATVANFRKKMAYGKKLARIGALASAEKEAQHGLKLVAESLDFSTGLQNLYANKIDDVFIALDEINDFRTAKGDLAEVIHSHRTPILKNESPSSLSRNSAQLAYLSYAEEQLNGIFANYNFCSDAFFTLGKIFLARRIGNENTEVATMKAMLMFRMAVSLNPADGQSANELGALYAGLNYLDVAKDYFLQSVRNSPTPNAWRNLARIHRLLGEHQLAAQAENEYARVSQGLSRKVAWVAPDEFGRSNQLGQPNGSGQQRMPANRRPNQQSMQQSNFQHRGNQNAATQNGHMQPGFQPMPSNSPQNNAGRIAGIPIPNFMNFWK